MWENDRRKIIFLAYCNRYILPLLCFFRAGIYRERRPHNVTVFGRFIFPVFIVQHRWHAASVAAYLLCLPKRVSQKMTPEHIRWDDVSFSDKYGLPILFAVIAFAAFACYFLHIV